MDDPVLHEIGERDNMADACIAIINIVRAVKREIGAEKCMVNVRISPEDTTIEVEPWEPFESDTKALINALAGRMLEIRERKGEDGDA